MFFASDNSSGIAGPILEAIARAAEGYAPAYGRDELTQRLTARVREVFEAPEAVVCLTTTGTAANALALSTLVPPWATVWCHAEAHLEQDESTAPHFYIGGKLSLLDGPQAMIDPASLERGLAAAGSGDVHGAQPGALSLTQATERGAVYRPDEIAALAGLAHDAGMAVHMDGTRLANALARTGARPAAMTWRAGVDALSLGATKSGAMMAEAVLLFDPARAWELELRRKRGGHLISKHRFLAAQMLAWLEDGLWLRLAGHANAMADRLAAGLRARGVAVTNRVDANLVFARLSPAQDRALRAAGATYAVWPSPDPAEDADAVPVRLVTSFSTGEAEVDAFLAVLG